MMPKGPLVSRVGRRTCLELLSLIETLLCKAATRSVPVHEQGKARATSQTVWEAISREQALLNKTESIGAGRCGEPRFSMSEHIDTQQVKSLGAIASTFPVGLAPGMGCKHGDFYCLSLLSASGD